MQLGLNQISRLHCRRQTVTIWHRSLVHLCRWPSAGRVTDWWHCPEVFHFAAYMNLTRQRRYGLVCCDLIRNLQQNSEYCRLDPSSASCISIHDARQGQRLFPNPTWRLVRTVCCLRLCGRRQPIAWFDLWYFVFGTGGNGKQWDVYFAIWVA